jgi:hypothetical protein
MKKTLIVAILSLFAVGACAQDRGQPVYGKTTPNPVVEPELDQTPKYKKVCIDTKDKAGKSIKKCRTVKVHQKLEGTPVPKTTK